jgi:hypothetical protein
VVAFVICVELAVHVDGVHAAWVTVVVMVSTVCVAVRDGFTVDRRMGDRCYADERRLFGLCLVTAVWVTVDMLESDGYVVVFADRLVVVYMAGEVM